MAHAHKIASREGVAEGLGGAAHLQPYPAVPLPRQAVHNTTKISNNTDSEKLNFIWTYSEIFWVIWPEYLHTYLHSTLSVSEYYTSGEVNIILYTIKSHCIYSDIILCMATTYTFILMFSKFNNYNAFTSSELD